MKNVKSYDDFVNEKFTKTGPASDEELSGKDNYIKDLKDFYSEEDYEYEEKEESLNKDIWYENLEEHLLHEYLIDISELKLLIDENKEKLEDMYNNNIDPMDAAWEILPYDDEVSEDTLALRGDWKAGKIKNNE